MVFLLQDKENEGRPGLWLVKGSKEGTVQLSFYDDICYSMGKYILSRATLINNIFTVNLNLSPMISVDR